MKINPISVDSEAMSSTSSGPIQSQELKSTSAVQGGMTAEFNDLLKDYISAEKLVAQSASNSSEKPIGPQSIQMPTETIPCDHPLRARRTQRVKKFDETLNETRHRIDTYIAEERQRRDRLVQEINSQRKVLFVSRTRANVREMIGNGLCAVTVSDFKRARKHGSGPFIGDAFEAVIILVDEKMLFDWETYRADSDLHSWSCTFVRSRLVDLGGSKCRVGLLWCPSIYSKTSPLRLDFAAFAIRAALFLNEPKEIRFDYVALKLMTRAFADLPPADVLLPRLAQFCQNLGPTFTRRIQTGCLRAHKGALRAFKGCVEKERRRWQRKLEMERARKTFMA